MFSENLVRLQKASGLTWYRIAVDSGVDHNLLWRYRNGKAKPRVENLIKLSEVLKCSVDELVK